MSINVNQKNQFGNNNSSVTGSGNVQSTKVIWKARKEGAIVGAVVGIILSIVANYIYDLITTV